MSWLLGKWNNQCKLSVIRGETNPRAIAGPSGTPKIRSKSMICLDNF